MKNLRSEIIKYSKMLNSKKLSALRSGNISTRFKNGFLITPSGKKYSSLKNKDIVFVSLKGSFDKKKGIPSSEWKFHQDIYISKKKAKAICSACHGIDGQAAAGGNSVIIPNITAQHKDYLIARLKAYKAGKIQHDQMTIIAGMLSEQDIENVAEWYSRIKIRIFDPNLVLSKPSN